MGIFQRIKEGVAKFVKPRPKPVEQVTYTTTTQDGATTKTTVSDQAPRKPLDEKLNEKMRKHDANTQNLIGKAKEAGKKVMGKIKEKAAGVEQFASRAISVAEKAPQKLIAKVSQKYDIPVSGKGISRKEAVRLVRKDISIIASPIMTAFAGVPERKFEKEREPKGKKTLYGRKISKKEEKTLQKKYGRNWRMALRQDRQRRLYTLADPIQRASIQRRNKLQSASVDFGGAFPETNVFLSSEYARVPFARRSDDPFDIDAMFMGGEHVVSKRRRDPFNIDANFKGKLKL